MRRLTAVATAALALLAVAAVAACEPQSDRDPGRRPTGTPVVAYDTSKIKLLCDYFHARPHEVLLTPGAEGNVTDLRTADGVPQSLSERARQYYEGELLSGTGELSKGRRARLDDKYAIVIKKCESYGWSAVQPT